MLLNPPAAHPVLRDNYCGFMAKASYLWPPIDLLVQSGWLAGKFSLGVMDAVAERMSDDACLSRLRGAAPDALFMLSSSATFKDDAEFARRLKEALPEVALITGMSPLVQEPQAYLEAYPWVDAMLLDYSSPDLRDALLGRERVGPDLVRRGQGELAERPAPRRLSYPTPRHDLFPLERYSMPLGWRGRFSTVLTGFGCAHSCSFCTGASIRYRRRRKEEVLAELEILRAMGIENLFMVDYTFTSSRRYVLELCREMARFSPRFRWTSFGRVDQLDDEVVLAMKDAGCDLLQLGVESGDDAILKRYRKGFSVDQARRAFARCRRLGLRTLAFFIIGLPGETRESVEQSVQLALELDPDLASFSVPTPDPGTTLLDEAVRQGVVDGGPVQVLSTVGPTLPSEGLSDQEIRRLREEAIRRFYLRPGFLLRQARSLRSLSDLKDRAKNAMTLLGRSR